MTSMANASSILPTHQPYTVLIRYINPEEEVIPSGSEATTAKVYHSVIKAEVLKNT